jgi:hypothetical protein
MNTKQFLAALSVIAVMSLAGSFSAVYLLQGEPVQAQDKKAVTGSEYRLVDGNGKLRSLLSVDKNNNVLFTLLDANEKVRMSQTVGNDGGAAIVLNTADGKPRMSLTSDSGQPGAFTVFDSKGDAAALLAVGEEDFPTLTLMRGKTSVLAGITSKGNGVFALSDEGGQFFSATGGGDMPSTVMLNNNKAGTGTMLTNGNDGIMQLSMTEKDKLLAFLMAGGGKSGAFQLEHVSGSIVRLQAQSSGHSLIQLGGGENYARIMRYQDGAGEFAIIKEKKFAWKEEGK